MPVGDDSDLHSALGIITMLGEHARILLASAMEIGAPEAQRVLGCVLGSVLDEKLINVYRIGEYGARTGDGLLAYIGLVPHAQGARVSLLDDDIW